MEDKKAALLLNGDYRDIDFYKDKLNEYKFIVGVDGGSNILRRLNIKPDILVGDFDSIDEDVLKYFEKLNIPMKKFSKEKDYTDSQLGILHLEELGYRNIDIYGGFGNRLDHSLGNVGLIYWAYNNGISVRMFDENNEIQGLAIGKTRINRDNEKIFSILAVFENLEGLSISDAKYELDGYKLKKGSPRGISNEFLDKEVTISLENGFGLLIISNKI
ncbi:MAG: thiamine diphosphokinase [Filifactoraceae bacterium]